MISWIKKNKLATILLFIVTYFIGNLVYKNLFGLRLLSLSLPQEATYNSGVSSVKSPSFGSTDMALPNTYPQQEYAPQADVQERLVIQESSLSLLVKNVIDSRNKILEYANTNGGYMVNSNTSNPQDSPTGTVVIRIPADKLQDALDYFHLLSVKVVSENLVGRDVTDQYVDIDTRISQIERSKKKLEEILDRAEKISDITSLTQQILNYQNQIDNWKGQQDALKKKAELAKLTIYLATDEIALPYTPNETFRPNVIFKLAVRSLVRTFRNIAELAIWVGVYSAIWIPILLIYIFGRRWWKNRQKI